MLLDASVDSAVDATADTGADTDVPDSDLPDSDTPDVGGDADLDASEPPDSGPIDQCEDGRQNGDETDVDCGGSECSKCEEGQSCGGGDDCADGICIGNECQPARCSDGVFNGTESDVDCGGDCPAGCELGRMCGEMDDCASPGVCSEGVCSDMHCFNGITDEDETDEDCGGAECVACDAGQRCEEMRDCASGECDGGFCLTPACTNEEVDEGESDVDCGGDTCPGCADGLSCGEATDCINGRCEDGTCTSCVDGIVNGDESDVDCGGSCGGCGGGDACEDNSDCLSDECLPDGTCTGPTVYYEEDFNATDGGWTSGGENDPWEHGVPADDHTSEAHSAPNAWATDLAGSPGDNVDAWVMSPTINLSAADSDPVFEFWTSYNTESCCDGAWVEVSTDDGETWTKLGDDTTGRNWYNRTSDEWAGRSEGWVLASHVLTGTAGERDVRVRVFYSSDFSADLGAFVFDDITIREPTGPNLAVTLEPLPETCGQVRATISNVGEGNAGTFRLVTTVDGTVATEMVTGLDGGATITRTFNGGLTSASVEAEFADDIDDSDNAATLVPEPGSVIPLTGAYFQGFEDGAGGWAATGTNSTWALGSPSGEVINAAFEGSNAYVTNLSGDYTNSENSRLVSPCFDASGTPGDLALSFAIRYETESCCDEGWVEFSVDGGATWEKIEAGVTTENWYNDLGNQWWDGESEGWFTASAVLPGTAGTEAFRLRYVFSADGSITGEGFAIDNVRLTPLQTDLAVELVPGAACGTAVARVTNVGGNTVASAQLRTRTDGGSVEFTSVPGPIEFGETVEVNVGMAGGTEVSTELVAAGDVVAANNTDSLSVARVVIGAGYSENFESGAGGWVSAGTNASWELGSPSGGFITAPGEGSASWVTNLDGEYNANELSYLLSPCFDFSGVATTPEVSFQHIFRTEACCDEGWFELSTDGGETWNKLGTEASGTNWYTDATNDWWDGASGVPGGWVTATHPLTGTAGQASVRLRFVMSSDGTTANDGFGVDSISITP